MKKQGWIAGLQRARADRQDWLERIAGMLPEELRDSLTGVEHRGGQLTVLTGSAAWCSRVRFAMGAIEPRLRAAHPDIVKVLVRVAPAGRAARPAAD
ncbi:MAG TPA: DciA family protein [Steroidobacteraceae bacterium]|nr:DciA family protein [Steroidobacteraceae bacterium]